MEIDNLQISDKDYNFILTAIGYPVIDEETLNYLITKEDVEELVITPALETFHQYFPKRVPLVFQSTGTSSVLTKTSAELPKNAFGILSAQFVTQSASSLGIGAMDSGVFYQNPFYSNAQVYSSGGGSIGGMSMFGVPFGYGFETQRFQKMFYAKSLEASTKVYWYRYDPSTRSLSYKSNLIGNFYIDFATLDENIDNIDFTKKRSFLRYCQGALKVQIANTLALVDTQLPVQLNKELLKTDGDDLMEKEVNYWQEASTIPTMR